MRNYTPLLIGLTLALGGCSSAMMSDQMPDQMNSNYATQSSSGFTLTSADVRDGGAFSRPQFYSGFGCSGGNISPQLTWSNPPAGTKSFAVTMYDPDAPSGSGWWHWVVYNLKPNVRSLQADAGNDDFTKLPSGASMALNDFGYIGFGGTCPPQGQTDRYQLTVYALDVDYLDIPEGSTGAYVGFNLMAHVIGKAQIVTPTSRKNQR